MTQKLSTKKGLRRFYKKLKTPSKSQKNLQKNLRLKNEALITRRNYAQIVNKKKAL